MKKTSIIFLLLLALPLVTAIEPTQQFNRILLEPYYYEEFPTRNIWYDYTLDFNPPEGVSDVVTALFKMDILLNPTIDLELLVNGQHCQPNIFTVSTSFANAEQTHLSFDCSNVITKAGTYNISIKPDDDTGSSYAWIDVTYKTKPPAEITVFGTEYLPNQRAKVWLQLINSTGDYVNDAICQVDIYTPDNTVYVEKAPMDSADHDGIYYYDLLAPVANGVYPAIARCYYVNIETQEHADNFTILTGTVNAGTYTDTTYLDGSYHELREANVGGVKRLNATYTFNNLCGLDINEQFLTGVSVKMNAEWLSVPNDNIVISWYNWTNNQWTPLQNKLLAPTNFQTVGNLIPTNNVTKSGIVNTTTNSSRIRVMDTNIADTGTDQLRIDHLEMACQQFSNPEWQEVKGSSELHVTSEYNYIPIVEYGTLYNNTFLDGFDLYYTVASATPVNITDQEITLPAFKAFPAHHIKNVQYLNSTSNWENISFYIELGADDIPQVVAMLDLNEGENYEVRIIMENAWKRTVFSDTADIQIRSEKVTTLCVDHAIDEGFSNYTIPSTLLSVGDELYTACQGYFDHEYEHATHASEFFALIGFGTTNLTRENLLTLDAKYFHLQDVAHEAIQHAEAILDYYTQEQLELTLFSINSTLNILSGNTTQSFLDIQNLIITQTNLSMNQTQYLIDLVMLQSLNQYANLTAQMIELQEQGTSQYVNLTSLANLILANQQTLNSTTTNTLALLTQLNQTSNENFLNLSGVINQNYNSILSINNTLTTAITNAKVEILNAITSLNATLVLEINGLNQTLANHVNTILNLISVENNYTQNQIEELNSTITNFQNTNTQKLDNILLALAGMNNTINQVETNTNIIITNQATLNSTVNQIIVDIANLNQTISDEFTYTNSLINQVYANLTLDIANQFNINNATLQAILNQTQENEWWLIEIWTWLTGFLNNTVTNIENIVTNNQNNINILLNQTNLSSQPAQITIDSEVTTTNCITGSNWDIAVIVYDQYNNPMTPPVSCDITTGVWGTDTMTYDSPYFTYSNTCPSPQSWNYSITCI